MTIKEPPAVDPLIPLMLLEAVRAVDRPDDADVEAAEYVPELLNKRLGMHERVFVAIRRYNDAVRRNHRIDTSEVVALARLIGRRADAMQVFDVAGRATAQRAYARIAAPVRGLIRVLPAFAARPWARRRARKIIKQLFGAKLERYGAALRMRLPEWRAVTALEAGAAAHHLTDAGESYYEAGLKELLVLLALD